MAWCPLPIIVPARQHGLACCPSLLTGWGAPDALNLKLKASGVIRGSWDLGLVEAEAGRPCKRSTMPFLQIRNSDYL